MKVTQPESSPAADLLDPVIDQVRTRFVAEFPLRCDIASAFIDRCVDPAHREEASTSLRTLAHKLSGLAGIIGFHKVSSVASELEQSASGLQDGSVDWATARSLVDAVRAAFADEITSSQPVNVGETESPKLGTILVAEDDDDQRLVVTRHLENAGYETHGVASGELVLGAARSVRPSVLLLDVEMPGLDGFSVCRQLKADSALSTIPVVFMTTRNRVDDRLTGLALGADDFLTKPVDMRELLLRIGRAGDRGIARAEDAASSGILSFDQFEQASRSRLSRSPASLVFIRLPAEHFKVAVNTVKDEIRRADLAGVYDRTHLLLLLPEVSGAVAFKRTVEIVARLADRGLRGTTAGVTYCQSGGTKSIEELMAEADDALMHARSSGKPVVCYDENPDRQRSPAAAGSILVADDDPDVIRIVDAQMKGAGYSTRLAFDGAQAVAALDAQHPDVLILDLMMPKLSGFDVLAKVSRLEEPRPKVLVLSVRRREDDVTRAFELGANDYLQKPFNPQELLARVARLLR
jgi:DNA-binding response OmpR family regulator/HPt (histidine-containing phosphotransfer) domain-containing protein